VPKSNREAQPMLYGELAGWFHLLTRPENYLEEAAIFTAAIERTMPSAQTVLELGCGGGNNASHLKRRFDLTLTDLSPEMVAVSRTLNPELRHEVGDMRLLRLGQTFDVVFIHDAISYLTTEDDVAAAFATAYEHTRPGGMVLAAPDYTRENFRPSTSCGGYDGEEVTPPQPGRALRYLQWTYDPDPSDTRYLADFAYLLREGESETRIYRDRHVLGLFPLAIWLSKLAGAGYRPEAVPFEHSELDQGHVFFVGTRPR